MKRIVAIGLISLAGCITKQPVPIGAQLSDVKVIVATQNEAMLIFTHVKEILVGRGQYMGTVASDVQLVDLISDMLNKGQSSEDVIKFFKELQ